MKLLCALGVIAMVAACGDDDGTDPFSTRRTSHQIDLRVARTTLNQDDTVTVTPAITDVQTGDTLKPTYSYRSTVPTVASVSATTGLVRALLPGTTMIIASARFNDSTYADTVNITVTNTNAVSTAQILTPDTSLFIGDTKTLSTVLKNAAGTTLTTRARSFTSKDTTIASVSSAGVVSARATGTVNVILSSEGKADTVAVTVVRRPVASVIVTPNPATVNATRTVQLSAETRAANGSTLTGRTVTWVSDNPAIATVNPTTGLVTGVLGIAGGNPVTIRATSEGATGFTQVIVFP